MMSGELSSKATITMEIGLRESSSKGTSMNSQPPPLEPLTRMGLVWGEGGGVRGDDNVSRREGSESMHGNWTRRRIGRRTDYGEAQSEMGFMFSRNHAYITYPFMY
ncbi:hypothetical protein VNO77_25898 [Canavalia gladiata]|uniref:Uncharacterized protein n=1 Tax=Canavalia gladiata TaxID=3824 RepID=A0AAN9KRF5_CANGL